MFYVGVAIWLFVVAACLVLSRNSRARSLVRARYIAPLYWVAVVAAVTAGFAPLITPGPEENPSADQFSTDRARAHIDVIASRPHPMGSEASEEVRAYIAEQLESLGLAAEFQAVAGVRDYYSSSGATVPVVNVIARIPGAASTGSIALVAHYDTVPETPGANDNTSGVAVLLETARLLLEAEEPLRNDVVLLFPDAEEPAPRYGSTAFVDHHPLAADVSFVVNLEAIGSAGPSMISETNGPRSWVLDRYVSSVPQPVAFSFLAETMELLGGSNTDFAPFRDAGVPGVEFVYTIGSPIYHTAADSADSVSAGSLHSHGTNTVALVRELGERDLTDVGGGDSVFFTVGRFRLVQYPESLAVPLIVVAGLALAGTIWRHGFGWAAVARSAGSTLVTSILLGLGSTLIWVGLAGWRSSMGILESYLYLLGFAALVMAVVVSLRRGPADPIAPAGVLAVWWTFGVATSLVAPGISYLFVIPVLLGAVVLAGGSAADRSWERLGTAVLAVGVTMVLLVPAIDTYFQFAQPRPGNLDSQILPTIAVPVFLLALVIELACSFHPLATHFVSTPRSAPTLAEHQPLDPVNGLRVGTVIGTLAGATIVAVGGLFSFWIVVGLAAIGGGIGYWSEKRKLPAA
ncbi:MAG: M20/M25/M40 family metallo-hydrolase [Acidimicrobiales bacterium]